MLYLIFLIAIILRFLYFPENIYFGFDQARDGYSALEIFNGNLKIIGPTTAFEGLHHGVLYYYIIAPFYGLGNMNPELVAGLMRILNALGIFPIFFIAKTLFDKKVGLLAALFFTFSFEQTQFSIYMGNPSLAVLSVMIFYLGLALVIFSKKNIGLPITLLGLGASIQFQFALTYLITPLLLIFIIYRKVFLKLPIKIWLLSFLSLAFSLSTFIIAELKYSFPTIQGLLLLSQSGSQKNLENIFSNFLFSINRMVMYNISGNLITIFVLVLLLFFLVFLIREKGLQQKLIFLSIWFFSFLVTLVVNGGVRNPFQNPPLYYPNVGVSVALIIFTAFLISKTFNKNKFLGASLIIFVLFANFSLIKVFNPQGNFSEISVQQGMLLGDEKKVLDYMYNQSNSEAFAVKAVTMPLFINTTWSYLFEWYGKNKYGYLPIWNGKNALGYYGNLKVQEAQEGLPDKRFLIIEPTRGIAPYLIDDYLKEENYFTKIVNEKSAGAFIIQEREKF